MASSLAALGNTLIGYTATQAVFTVLYLLLACLDGKERLLLRRLCAVWAAAVAAMGIIRFALWAVAHSAKRLECILSNPNALGIFLVLGWFALMSCGLQEEERGSAWVILLRRSEPLLLIAAALTLSLGSFAAMAGGILVLFVSRVRETSLKDALLYVCRILARASLGFGTGLLLYLTASWTDAPWLCVPLLLYVLAEAVCWEKFRRFLKAYWWMAVGMTFAGLLVAAMAVIVRPSSFDTFTERLAMMRNGLGYLTANPLLGVGPYQWRMLNLLDADKYFNTYHIHNIFIHIGVESGLIAMAMMFIIAVRCFRKKDAPAQRAQCAAFLFHNLMDTSFFYVGITSAMLLTAGEPEKGGKQLPPAVVKLLFGAFALMCAYNLYSYNLYFQS